MSRNIFSLSSTVVCEARPSRQPQVQSRCPIQRVEVMQLIPLSQLSHWSLIPTESTSYGYLRATHASMSPLTLPYSRPSGLLTWCHGLNVCATPKFICGNPNPQCDGIWRWSLGGGEAFMVALAPLRRDRKALSSSLFFTLSLHNM